MTTIAKIAVGGAVVLALFTAYHNTKGQAPIKPPAAELDLRAPGWRGWKLEPVKPAPAPVVAPAPAPRPAPVSRKRPTEDRVVKHPHVKPPAPFVAPPPPPPPRAPGWSERLLGAPVDRSTQRQR